MATRTDLMARLGIELPVIQAPMAGGGDTAELVAATGIAGGIGFIAGAYRTPDQIAEVAAAVRAATDRPFGINLFAPLPAPDVSADPGPALDRVAPFFAELGLPAPDAPTLPPDGFEDQLAAALDSGAAAFSFTFGIPPTDAVDRIKAKDMLFVGTATTVAEAVALERAGADAIVAQGAEAGGHRGSFDPGAASPFEAGLIGSMALVPQVADTVSVPVIASGGIMDGRGIAAALALGAQAVQMGTAFLTCAEAGIPDAYKAAILAAAPHETRVTRAFSGRPARGIANRFMDVIEDGGKILPFPLQNSLTRPMRTEAGRQGKADFLSLWAGQGLGLARRESAAELVDRLAGEIDGAIAALGGQRRRGLTPSPPPARGAGRS